MSAPLPKPAATITSIDVLDKDISRCLALRAFRAVALPSIEVSLPDMDQELRRKLGERVRQLRERAGLSQGDLSQASGVSRVYLGVVERAEKEVGLSVIGKIASGLGVDPVELFRFSSSEGHDDPAEKLGKKVAALARGASPSRLAGFEVVARVFFEPESKTATKRRVKRKGR